MAPGTSSRCSCPGVSLKTESLNRTTVYLLGDSYTANNELISKALAIGLQELKEKGEI